MRSRPSLGVAGVHVRVSILNELQYRSNFFLQILQSILQAVSGLAIVAVVFDKVDELNGWRRSELLAAIGVFTIVGGLMRAFIQPAMGQMMSDVEDGSFDFVLTRPADAQLIASVRRINVWELTDVIVGIGIVAVAAPAFPSSVGPAEIAAFVGFLAAGAIIAYSLCLTLASFAFWVVRMPYMDNLFFYIARAAQYPIGIYPMWLRVGLTSIIPLGIAVTAPSEAITSRLTLAGGGVVLAVTIAMVAISRTVWKRGLRRYTGASS